MIDIEFKGIQVGPNPAFAGENFILKVKVAGKALRWDDVSGRSWNEVSTKAWD